MGSITKRVYEKTGRTTYRVQFKRKGVGSLSITFDDYEEACKFLEVHEQYFRENPEYYFKWRDSLIHKFREEKLKVRDHIIFPKLKGKKK